jgi:adenylate kinase
MNNSNQRLKDLIFLGPPGCGKGTQSKLLHALGYVQISTGDLLREEISRGSELGKEISSIIDKGNLISDELALSLIKSKITDVGSFIFDGFPRTVAQATMLNEVLAGRDVQVILFDIDGSDLVDRIVFRRTCPSCGGIFNLKNKPLLKEDTCNDCGHIGLTHRKDDEASVLKKRLEVFHLLTAPVIQFYHNEGSVISINGASDAEEVQKEILSIVKL